MNPLLAFRIDASRFDESEEFENFEVNFSSRSVNSYPTSSIQMQKTNPISLDLQSFSAFDFPLNNGNQNSQMPVRKPQSFVSPTPSPSITQKNIDLGILSKNSLLSPIQHSEVGACTIVENSMEDRLFRKLKEVLEEPSDFGQDQIVEENIYSEELLISKVKEAISESPRHNSSLNFRGKENQIDSDRNAYRNFKDVKSHKVLHRDFKKAPEFAEIPRVPKIEYESFVTDSDDSFVEKALENVLRKYIPNSKSKLSSDFIQHPLHNDISLSSTFWNDGHNVQLMRSDFSDNELVRNNVDLALERLQISKKNSLKKTAHLTHVESHKLYQNLNYSTVLDSDRIRALPKLR
ncbi:hypothetical protein HK096_006080 [Nowakowskiella sp. JEL0078]|nr:hypothetical protein HK096_006080 [Nowakowskiella sp. JEL0078]